MRQLPIDIEAGQARRDCRRHFPSVGIHAESDSGAFGTEQNPRNECTHIRTAPFTA